MGHETETAPVTFDQPVKIQSIDAPAPVRLIFHRAYSSACFDDPRCSVPLSDADLEAARQGGQILIRVTLADDADERLRQAARESFSMGWAP